MHLIDIIKYIILIIFEIIINIDNFINRLILDITNIV
jgi:hypothetical protein